MTSLAKSIDASVLAAIAAPGARSGHSVEQKRIMEALGALLPDLLERFDIVTPLRIAHFLAQVAHESDAFKTTVEYASGAAYEGRADLGNTQPGDGKRFKGRGLIQLTGRANYRKFTAWMRSDGSSCPDFERTEGDAATFPWAAWSAFWYWSTRSLNVLAERDDLAAITRVINGGRNGLDDRAANLKRAKIAIAAIQAGNMRSAAEPLHRGSKGPLVDRLQRALAAAGLYRLSIDGDFGAGTEQALRSFQQAHGLAVDGIAGDRTMAALAPYLGNE